MRPLLRPARLVGLALVLSATIYAQYLENSSSARSHQRRLESDGVKLRDSIRSQRNTPSPRSSSVSTSDWLNQMQAANHARDASRQRDAEQRRAEADWRRDHPNETPAQYFGRIEKEAAENAEKFAYANGNDEGASEGEMDYIRHMMNPDGEED